MVSKSQELSQALIEQRVLVVEDVDSMREHLGELLRAEDWVSEVRLAANTWEARLALTRHQPTLLLLDEVIPGESPVDFLAEVPPAVRVVLVSSFGASEMPEFAGTISGRVQKPEDEAANDRTWAEFVSEIKGLAVEV